MNSLSENQIVKHTITEYYEEDHDRLDELFKNFQKWKHSDYSRAKEYFVQFKFGLQRHIIWEEEVLFPLFEQKTGMEQYGPTAVMRGEHQQIGEYLEALHQKVQKSDPESSREEGMLVEVLGLHNQKEENILYPAIDRMITPEERESVFTAMNNIPVERYEKCCSH